MESKGIFGGTISLLEKVLDLRSMKHNLIVSNIANVDTPNYKAFDLMVEEELEKAVGEENNMGLKRTQPGHLPGNGIGLDSIRPSPVTTDPLSIKGDGNSVDIDRVMADQAKNSLMYSVSAEILSRKFMALKNAIEGGNK
jgi:flagellar basal-body rod protein FlgB